MRNASSFRMVVRATFSFGDGRTVFVGAVDDSVPFVGPCTCDLVRDRQSLLTLTIEGEMLPRPRLSAPTRAVSTTEPVPAEILAAPHGLELIGHAGSR